MRLNLTKICIAINCQTFWNLLLRKNFENEISYNIFERLPRNLWKVKPLHFDKVYCTQNNFSLSKAKIITSRKISPKQCLKNAKTRLFSDAYKVLYKAKITPNEQNSKTKFDYGASETVLKLRYANHRKEFNNIKYENEPEIPNEYLNIISANKMSNISCKTLETHKSYNQSSKRCFVCLN